MRYLCTDGVCVEMPDRTREGARRGIAYTPKQRPCVVALANTLLSRSADEVLETDRDVAVAVLPRTVK